ncbi:hypothetical protein C2845_PM03G03560 [Panicum miliaceum]|uniref:Uncharacterized protein n=1 Tax=Panicum miliaceum TaxID=4540 RepID=A0A3L6TAP0_PANMI|nr:hypothetical protein C2845_PM03G03560 [Panicum miliaceum]
MVKVAAMMDGASVNVCRRRSSVGMKPPLSEDMDRMSGRRTRKRGHAARIGSVWDGMGRRGSGAQVPLILRRRVQIPVYLVWVMSATFGQSWRQWPKVSSRLQVFSREILAPMMVRDGDEWLLLGNLLASCGFCERKWRAVKGVSRGDLASQVGRNCGERPITLRPAAADHSDSNGIPSWSCCVGTVRREF